MNFTLSIQFTLDTSETHVSFEMRRGRLKRHAFTLSALLRLACSESAHDLLKEFILIIK
jgi:hypothetical protein